MQNKEFRVKSYFTPPVEGTDISLFCWNLGDDLENFIESSFKSGQNLSNQKKGALKNLMVNKNKMICVNDTDKNLGAANEDTFDVKSKCRRQLYDTFTYTKLSEVAKEEFIRNIKFQRKSRI